MKEIISLNIKEQRRVLILNQVIAGELTVEKAATLLGLSHRQVWRLLGAYRKEGVAALAHGNRKRTPVNALAAGLPERVRELARTTYAGFNQQHLTEKLNEVEGITIGRSSVRRILRAAGMGSPRTQRRPRHRSRRERYPQAGMLLQIDGSRHDWLEGRGPYLSLLGAIDDATGEVVGAVFREQEDAAGYFLLLRQVVQSQGIPLALYRDRHGIFEPLARRPLRVEEQLQGRREPTQFGRMLEELEITSIGARSPQAKGRIERLWGTWQDRLVAEMRLAGVRDQEEANRFLPAFLAAFNRRFRVPAAQAGSAYRAVAAGFTPETVFCFKYRRVVAADNTVRLGEHRLQLLPNRERISYAKAQVAVHERLDGSLAVYLGDTLVASQPAPPEAPVLRARGGRLGTQPTTAPTPPAPAVPAGADPAPRSPSRPVPGPDHPWRRGVHSRPALAAGGPTG